MREGCGHVASLLTAAQRAGTLADVEAILAHMQELNVCAGRGGVF